MALHVAVEIVVALLSPAGRSLTVALWCCWNKGQLHGDSDLHPLSQQTCDCI